MLSVVHSLAQAMAPWQHEYNDSTTVETAVTSVHLLALLFGGGLAVAADRSTLRVARAPLADRSYQLSELHAVHRPVLIALLALFVSGVMLALADVRTYATSVTFWIKMGLVLLLVINGAVLTRTESALRREDRVPSALTARLWRRLRTSAVLSIVLWGATLLAGAVLVNAS